jgi:hypothetical protein
MVASPLPGIVKMADVEVFYFRKYDIEKDAYFTSKRPATAGKIVNLGPEYEKIRETRHFIEETTLKDGFGPRKEGSTDDVIAAIINANRDPPRR